MRAPRLHMPNRQWRARLKEKPSVSVGRKRVASSADIFASLRRPGHSLEAASERLGVTRNALRRGLQGALPKETFQKVSVGQGVLAIAKIALLLDLFCREVPPYFAALSEAMATYGLLTLIYSFDEATAGNVLAPDFSKKSCVAYFAIKELGTMASALWLPVTVIGADVMKRDLKGRMGPVLRQLLQQTADLAQGFLVRPHACTSSRLDYRGNAVRAYDSHACKCHLPASSAGAERAA